MNIRNIIVAVALLGFGGFAVWDYRSADSQRLRDLSALEKLAPDVEIPSCYPKHPNAKVLAGAVWADVHSKGEIETEEQRRGALQHDCIRGANSRANVEKLAVVLLDQGVALFSGVIDGCKVEKTDSSPSACFALDGLAAAHTPKAIAVLEKTLASGTVAKEVALGALFRLLQTPGWKTHAQLVALIPEQKHWEAKELIVEKIREVRDPSLKEALRSASAAETDGQEKGKLMAAVLEIENPGRCVVEDQGVGADGICRYLCKDQQQHLRYPKVGAMCPLLHEPATPEVAAAALGK